MNQNEYNERIRQLMIIEQKYDSLVSLLKQTGLSTLIVDSYKCAMSTKEANEFNVKIDINRNPFHRRIFETVCRWGIVEEEDPNELYQQQRATEISDEMDNAQRNDEGI